MLDVKTIARQIRRDSLLMTHRARSSHIGSCLSAADILAHLFGYFLNISLDNVKSRDRDVFIMSKGHAAAALYAALKSKSILTDRDLETFCQDGSPLVGHVTTSVPGVDFSSGSLGHGLSVALGVALQKKRVGDQNKVVVLVSDGDLNEGAMWEALLLAPQLGLNNLMVVIDANGVQGLGSTDEVLSVEPLAEKLTSFRWAVQEINGHCHEAIKKCFDQFPFSKWVPSVVIARTVKGRGVAFMESRMEWHYRSVDEDLLKEALEQINAQ